MRRDRKKLKTYSWSSTESDSKPSGLMAYHGVELSLQHVHGRGPTDPTLRRAVKARYLEEVQFSVFTALRDSPKESRSSLLESNRHYWNLLWEKYYTVGTEKEHLLESVSLAMYSLPQLTVPAPSGSNNWEDTWSYSSLRAWSSTHLSLTLDSHQNQSTQHLLNTDV